MTTTLHPDDAAQAETSTLRRVGTRLAVMGARVTAWIGRLDVEHAIAVEDPGFWRDGLAETRSRVDAYEHLVAAAAAGRDGA